MKKIKSNSEDRDVTYQEHLRVTKQPNGYTLTIPLDETIFDPYYYREVVEEIASLGETDVVKFVFNSKGGDMEGAAALLAAMQRTPALLYADIRGNCDSAASMIALNCQAFDVSPYANMLVHFITYGAGGAANHVRKEVEHTQRFYEELFRDTYRFFLTEEEMNKCIEDNDQLWLSAEDVVKRLQHKQLMQQEFQSYEEEDEDDLYVDDSDDDEPKLH